MMKHILSSRRVGHLSFFLGCLCLHGPKFGLGFIPRAAQHRRPMFLFSTTSDEVAKMRAGEIKRELESYGISTKSFLEKSELVEALEKARAEGLKPKPEASTTTTTTTRKQTRTRPTTEASDTASSSSSSSSSSASSSSPKDTRPREVRFAEELEKCQAMKAGELKKELEERGVSTKSFFEKSEFSKALAEARVDGTEKPKEGYAEYANVEVLTDASAGPRPKQAAAKDQQSKQQQQQQSPFGGGAAGANPFAGMGDMGGMSGMSGMGGMGGIADLLKNMGGAAGPAAGANPFAGMGGGMGGMGDMMGKAQQMMKNPKVMEIMAKAQKNPKIMKAMQEVMGNPAAAAKYQNDPEVAELMNELKKFI